MWRLWDSLAAFEVIGAPAIPGEGALHLDGSTLLLRDCPVSASYDVSLDLAFPGAEGFCGIAFAAREPRWHELVYISAGGEVQYDPVMNGSNTWQVYPHLRAAGPPVRDRWCRLRLQVRPAGVAALVDGAATPALVVRPLRGGPPAGRVGVWGYLPCRVRNLRLVASRTPLPACGPLPPRPAGTIAGWRLPGGTPLPVEPSGVLNLNRHLPYAPGVEAELHADVVAAAAGDAILDVGYSDRLRLWLNGVEVHGGVHRWDPPHADGRILPAVAAVPVRLRKGANPVVARLAADEPFGWGLRVSVRRTAPAPAS